MFTRCSVFNPAHYNTSAFTDCRILFYGLHRRFLTLSSPWTLFKNLFLRLTTKTFSRFKTLECIQIFKVYQNQRNWYLFFYELLFSFMISFIHSFFFFFNFKCINQNFPSVFFDLLRISCCPLGSASRKLRTITLKLMSS